MGTGTTLGSYHCTALPFWGCVLPGCFLFTEVVERWSQMLDPQPAGERGQVNESCVGL